MQALLRNAVWAALASMTVLTLSGCPTPSKVDAGVDGGGTDNSCIDAQDCPNTQFFDCDTSKSQCVPACRTKADCSAATRGQYALPECAGALGCQCDEGRCNSALCSADSDCGGTLVCRNGNCVAAPASTEAAKCQVVPDLVVLKTGAAATFSVIAWNAAGNAIVLQTGGTWAAAAGGPLTGSGTGVSAKFTAATATPSGPADAVTVTIGSATCKAKAIVLAPAVGVVAIDELSGRPVAGADVVLSTPAGIIIPQGAEASVKTNAQGFAALTGAPAGAYSVSVFHPDFTYVTIANYESAGGDDHDFLSVYLRHNQTDKFGGYKGTMTNAPSGSSANVHAGIASSSLGGALTDLSLAQLLGESVPTKVKIGTFDNSGKPVPLPAGVYLGFSENKIKETVWAQGLAGVCTGADGSPDEAKIAAGTCGTRTAWGLTGDVPLSELPIDAVLGGLNAANIGTVLSRIIPIFKHFNSSVIRDVQFDLKQTPYDAGAGKYDFSDTSSFAAANLEFAPSAGATGNSVPLSFSYVAKLPELPKYNGQYTDGVLVLGGVNVAGRGVVPLGIGIAVNTDPKDGQSDGQNELSPGLVQVRMAPTHHGLEGTEYGLLIAALSAASITDSSVGLGASAIFPRVPGNKLAFDPKGSTPVNYTSLSFPVFPEGGKYNFVSAAQGALAGRSFTFKSTPDLSKIQVIRVNFYDTAEHRWVVFMNPAKVAQGFTLPKPPGTLIDRTFANGVSTGARSGMQMQFLRMKADPAAAVSPDVTFNNLVEFNNTNGDRITDLLTAFSFIDYGKPSVAFSNFNSGVAAAKGSKVVVTVKSFKLGTGADADGQVILSFSSNGAEIAGCPPQTSASETTAGNGTVEFTIANTCAGTNVAITATLANTATPAVAIVPAVAAVTSTPAIQ